jgi:hypothetical protein
MSASQCRGGPPQAATTKLSKSMNHVKSPVPVLSHHAGPYPASAKSPSTWGMSDLTRR